RHHRSVEGGLEPTDAAGTPAKAGGNLSTATGTGPCHRPADRWPGSVAAAHAYHRGTDGRTAECRRKRQGCDRYRRRPMIFGKMLRRREKKQDTGSIVVDGARKATGG